MLDEERPGHVRGDVGVVHRPEVVLERDDPRDQRGRLGTERLADELERVAQPLGLDAELVEGRDVGPLEDGLVGPDVLVGGQDPRARGVAHAMRARRVDRSDRRPRGQHEVPVVLDEPPVAARVELLDEQPATVLALLAPGREERLEAVPVAGRQRRGERLGGIDQHVEIADGAEPGRDGPQPPPELRGPVGPEAVAEDPPGRPHPARRDAHRMELLGVLALRVSRARGRSSARGGTGGPSGLPRRGGPRR